ncbi:hypothetical protein V7087_28670, partial [Neobacillus niacini]|uniref:hypothetical protein n=1 Tax=Neobacillus niacini TaxID=86668 RepID=UPI002FFDE0D9
SKAPVSSIKSLAKNALFLLDHTAVSISAHISISKELINKIFCTLMNYCVYNFYIKYQGGIFHAKND